MKMLDIEGMELFVNLRGCRVQQCVDGSHVIVDPGIQTAIAEGTKEELENYLKAHKP